MFDFLTIISNPQFFRAAIAIILVSLLTATIGTFAVFRESTFMVSTLAHGAWLGAAIGFLISYSIASWLNPLIPTTLTVLFLSAAITLFQNKITKDKSDVAIGVTFGLTMSLAVLFTSMLRDVGSRVLGIIFGDILFLTEMDLAFLTMSALSTTFLTVIIFERLLYISFDPEGSMAMGLNVALYDLILALLTSLAVVVLVKTVGVILVYAMLIIPPAAAREISKNPYQVAKRSFLISIFSGFAGLVLSIFINVAPSALMGLFGVLFYIFSLLKKG